MNATISATHPFAPPPSWSFQKAIHSIWCRFWRGDDETESRRGPEPRPDIGNGNGTTVIHIPRSTTLIDAIEDAVACNDAEMNKRRKYSKAAKFCLYAITVYPNGIEGQVQIDSFRSEIPRLTDQYELTRHVLEACKSETLCLDEYSGMNFASEDDADAGDSHVYDIALMNGPSRVHLRFAFHGEIDWGWSQSRATSPAATQPTPHETAPVYEQHPPAVPSLDNDSEPGLEDPPTAFDAGACTLPPDNGVDLAGATRPATAATTFISPSGGLAGETLITDGSNTRDAICVLRVRTSDGSDKTMRVDRLPFAIGREPSPDLADNAYVAPESAIRVSRQHLVLERLVGGHITVRNHAIQRGQTYALGQPMGERFFIQPVNADDRGGWHLLGLNKLTDQSIAIRLERA